MLAAGLVAVMLLAGADASAGDTTGPAEDDAGAPASSSATPSSGAPLPPPASNIPPPPPPLPIEPPPPPERQYGDRGAVELGLGFGYTSQTGFVGAGGARYFVVDRVAPGVEGTYVSGGATANSYGLILASLRLVPLRTRALALVVTGRAGRVMLGAHPDGWGAGGAAGIIFLFSPTIGFELGYEILRLFPSSFCADLTSCYIVGPVLGVRFGF